MINRAADLAIHASTALPLALGTHMSAVDDFYSSSAFASYRKINEAKAKLTQAYFGRFDAILKTLGNIGKALGKRR